MLLAIRHHLSASALLLLATSPLLAQERVPGETWMAYATPEEAGYSTDGLAEAKQFYDSLDAAAAIVIHDGAVLAAWGEVERRFMCHSVRKSFMSAAWGAHVDRGDADLSKTLAELGIDDAEPVLTAIEKRATILDLLKARSGVYRLAAYEPPENPKPPRHSHEPGTFWCYNNWDFNTLVTIYQQEFDCDFFEDFGATIAAPIGMQDYRPRDGYLHYELDKSNHPAYPFRMSARDMARFGLLYEREGHWGEDQVLSEDWVSRSSTPYSDSWGGGGYGLLWWTSGEEDLKALGMYSALGFGGHAIDVLPGADLILAFRVDTFAGERVSGDDREQLLRLLLAAKGGEPAKEPRLVSANFARPNVVSGEQWAAFSGEIEDPGGSSARVYVADDGALVLSMPNMGSFDLRHLHDSTFRIEDAEREVVLVLDDGGSLIDIVSEDRSNARGYALLAQGKIAEALAVLEENVKHFPTSANAHDSLGEVRETAGDLEGARMSYATAVDLAREQADALLATFEANLARVDEAAAARDAEAFATIDGTIDALYESVSFGPGEECNWDRLRLILLPEAIFIQPAARGEKRKVIDIESFFADFREFIATSPAKDLGFHESIAARRTDRFGDVAHSYVIFEPRFDPKSEEALGRGLDSVQLIRIDGRWWVVSITTEFERGENVLPARFLNSGD